MFVCLFCSGLAHECEAPRPVFFGEHSPFILQCEYTLKKIIVELSKVTEVAALK